jgi:hypothetical protein
VWIPQQHSIWKWTPTFIAIWLVAAMTAAGVLQLVGSNAASGLPPLECGRQLSSVSGERVTQRSVRVIVVLDEEWREQFGDDSESQARSLVSDVSGLYRDIGIHFLPTRIADWSSPDDVVSAEDLLPELSEAIPLDDEDVIFGFIGQHLPRVDGFAEVGGRVAVVGHHPGLPERDLLVLAHEAGHLFGAHHGCDVPGLAGVMADSGFEDPLVVCPCTRAILEANVARFHEG